MHHTAMLPWRPMRPWCGGRSPRRPHVRVVAAMWWLCTTWWRPFADVASALMCRRRFCANRGRSSRARSDTTGRLALQRRCETAALVRARLRRIPRRRRAGAARRASRAPLSRPPGHLVSRRLILARQLRRRPAEPIELRIGRATRARSEWRRRRLAIWAGARACSSRSRDRATHAGERRRKRRGQRAGALFTRMPSCVCVL
jgi:hypothetical protein